MNKEEFLKEIKKLNIKLTDTMLHQLEEYADFLLTYNEHTNLTAIKTKEEVYLKHFYDSFTLVKIANLQNGKLLDVGTGAGFPGLVLAIVFPNLKVTLLDSNNKKITFLNECIEKLHLQNVQTVYSRAEDYTRAHREYYDFVTSRAVAELRILLELNIPALKVNGNFLVMKGNLEEELEESINTMKILNCKILIQEKFELPNNGGSRTLMSIIKEKETDRKYPRTYDKIKKKSIN